MMYQILFYGGFSLSFLAFICSVILCIKFRIPYIIGLLSGITAKREAKKLGKKPATKLAMKPATQPVTKPFAKGKHPASKKYFHVIQEITFLDSNNIIDGWFRNENGR